MPSNEGLKGSKMPKMINLVSTIIRRYAGLDSKPRQKYGSFAKLSLAVTEACEVAKNPQIFLTRKPKHSGN